MSYLKLKNVSLKYKDFYAVKNIDLSLEKGEYALFLGPNGSGKSSLFSLMTTSQPVQDGEIIYKNKSLKDKNISTYRKTIGVCFQSPSLDPLLTVKENLMCHARLFHMNKHNAHKKISELLSYFNLDEKVDHAVSTLSGGMQRKVELIKALLPEVECLFLDEPSTGLDPSARRDLWNFLKKIKQRGTALCMTSHILEDTDEVDTCYFLKDGQIFLKGNPKDLIGQMGTQLLDIKTKDQVVTYNKLINTFSKQEMYQNDQSILILDQSNESLQKMNTLDLPEVISISLRASHLMDVYHYTLRGDQNL